jgi:resuscitation-promoting factor RpfB
MTETPPDFDAQTQNSPRPANRLWLLLLILTALISLVGSSILLLASLVSDEASPAINAEPVRITLQIGDDSLPVVTTARTVADLFAEQNILVEPVDVVSPGLDAELSDELVVIVRRARPVTITLDGQTQTIRTSFESPFDLLRLVGATVGPFDRVTLDGAVVPAAELVAWPDPVDTITVQTAHPITIIDGDTTTEFVTTGRTVSDALFEAEIDVFLSDTVQPALDTAIEHDLEIRIDRSRPITIRVDGAMIETRVNGGTVGSALAEAGVALNGLDYSIPAEDRPVAPGITVRVIRVREDVITEEDSLPYETRLQADNNLPLDTRAVIQAGQRGLYRRTIRVRYENDIEISREVEAEGVVQPAQDEVIGYGTQVVIRTLDTPEGPVQYWRKLRMYATSYHPAALGGDDRTSIGETLRKGIVAIDPGIVSYRTNLYVAGYGRGVAADTGGPRSTPYWIDLGYSDDDWIGWSRWVDVYLLLPVPDNITYILPDNERGGPVTD